MKKPFIIFTSLTTLALLSYSPSFAGGIVEPFREIAPLLDRVVVKQGDPFIEVFIDGWVATDCYKNQEFLVEKLKDRTQIVARFRQVHIEIPCDQKLKKISMKIADLDPKLEISRTVDVLGFKGWHRTHLTETK